MLPKRQEGVVALLRAVKRFNPAVHDRFQPYATARIRGELRNLRRKARVAVSRPKDVANVEWADYLPETTRELIDLAGHNRDKSVRVDLCHQAATERRLRRATGRLPGKERMLIRACFLDSETQTMEEFAREHGLSKTATGRIKERALARLRQTFDQRTAPRRPVRTAHRRTTERRSVAAPLPLTVSERRASERRAERRRRSDTRPAQGGHASSCATL